MLFTHKIGTLALKDHNRHAVWIQISLCVQILCLVEAFYGHCVTSRNPADSSTRQGSDLAILTLASSLTYTPTIQPACLPANPGQSYIGVVAMVAGFGRDENDKYQKDLEKTDVTTFDGAQCDEMGWHAARLKR